MLKLEIEQAHQNLWQFGSKETKRNCEKSNRLAGVKQMTEKVNKCNIIEAITSILQHELHS